MLPGRSLETAGDRRPRGMIAARLSGTEFGLLPPRTLKKGGKDAIASGPKHGKRQEEG